MSLPIHSARTRPLRVSIDLFYQRTPNSLTSCRFDREQVLHIAGRLNRYRAAMKEEMRQSQQLSRLLRNQSVHWLKRIEEPRPGHLRNGIRQRGLFFAAVKRVVAVPQRLPSRKIVLPDLSYYDLVAQSPRLALKNNVLKNNPKPQLPSGKISQTLSAFPPSLSLFRLYPRYPWSAATFPANSMRK